MTAGQLMRDAFWSAWGALPEQARASMRPLGGLARRSRTRSTPVPSGDPPATLPAGVVELDTLHGTFWFDASDEKVLPWIRSQATWEADVVRLLERSLRPGMTVVDVGANVGLHTVVAAQLVAPDGHVFAVEPVPWTVDVLRANLWRHGCENVTVLPLAAGAARAEARLSVPADGRSGASVVDAGGGDAVRVEPLDELVESGRVDVLKVDVEGSELGVLEGARKLIARSPGLIAVVEFRPRADGAAAMLARYEALGLELCRLRRDGRPDPAPAAELLSAPDDVTNIILRA
jgi:FkbM family methyltransferase